MDIILFKLLPVAVSAAFAIIFFYHRRDVAKIDGLESDLSKIRQMLHSYITEEQARRLIKDHIEHIHNDIRRLESKVDKLIDLEIGRK